MLVNKLLKRISDLEFAIEKLEKNEHYKYINGQAYFRQDYVLGREKEVDRLNNIIKEMEKELDLNLPFKVVGVRHLKNKLQELKRK